MARTRIHHRTSFNYPKPVQLGPHRLLLRPRENCGTRLLGFELSITPEAEVSWAHDVFGNIVATATFPALTDRLMIETRAEIELTMPEWPVFDIAASAISYPFRYSDDDWADLGSLAARYETGDGRLDQWARGFVAGPMTDTLSLLKDLNAGPSRSFAYEIREEEGTQTPAETLARGVGSCRDLASLFVEAARSLGFGARIVSGYLRNPYGVNAGSVGEGSTHAWAEVYLPGAGWIAFDPTNATMGGSDLVAAAVGRTIAQVMPVSGSFGGSSGEAEMTVRVSVEEV